MRTKEEKEHETWKEKLSYSQETREKILEKRKKDHSQRVMSQSLKQVATAPVKNLIRVKWSDQTDDEQIEAKGVEEKSETSYGAYFGKNSRHANQ